MYNSSPAAPTKNPKGKGARERRRAETSKIKEGGEGRERALKYLHTLPLFLSV